MFEKKNNIVPLLHILSDLDLQESEDRLVPAFPLILFWVVCGLWFAVVHACLLAAEVIGVATATSVREPLTATSRGVVVVACPVCFARARLSRQRADA